MRSKARFLVRIWATVAFSFGATVVAPARTIHVDATGTGDYPTIQAAIDVATDGDTVILQPGTYTGDGNRDIELRRKSITLRSTDPNDPDIVATTIIDCHGTEADSHRGFYFPGELGPNWVYYVLSGVTITNGYSLKGGAIRCAESSLTVNKCIINGNSATLGGGIYCANWASVHINDSTIENNSASANGGGIYCGHPWSNLRINNCMITHNWSAIDGGGIFDIGLGAILADSTLGGNSAKRGAAIFESGERPALDNCVIEGNCADEYGGGMYTSSSKLTLTNCAFSSNSTKYRDGSAIYADWSTSTLTNCTFNKNMTSGYGGGICTNEGESTLIDCTFNENTAGYGGAGICSERGSLILANCTFCQNRAPAGGGMYSTHTSSIVTNCAFSRNEAIIDGGGILNSDASFTLSSCTFSRNLTRSFLGRGGGLANKSSRGILRNCVMQGNSSGQAGGISNRESDMTLINCTLSGNRAKTTGRAISNFNSSLMLSSCVVWDGGSEIWNDNGSTATLTYCDIQGGWPGVGNIDIDPRFAESGYWDPNGTPDDISDDFWVPGDYHLKSQSGRWEPITQTWVKDDVTSPCIDAGDPMSPIGHEPFPNGGIINMGAYGGTTEASKSYFGEPICETIVAGDINGDCKVDFADFAILALHWLEDHKP